MKFALVLFQGILQRKDYRKVFFRYISNFLYCVLPSKLFGDQLKIESAKMWSKMNWTRYPKVQLWKNQKSMINMTKEMQTCTFAYACFVYSHEGMHKQAYAGLHKLAHTCAYVCMYMRSYLHACKCIHIHVYIRTNTLWCPSVSACTYMCPLHSPTRAPAPAFACTYTHIHKCTSHVCTLAGTLAHAGMSMHMYLFRHFVQRLH